MRKFNLLPLALAAIAFSACTSEEVAENNPSTGEGTTSYVAVNINSVGTSGSRADGDYADGSAKENKINAVRFYFFTENGEAYNMGTTNYVEKENPTGEGKLTPNVEKITDAMLVIDGETKTAPHSMIAVVNPATIEEGVLQAKMTKTEVEAAVARQNFNAQGANAKDFVMSSSVYSDGTNKVWVADITGHVATDQNTAMQNPVDIYVERVAAKLTSTATGAKESGKFHVGETTNGKKVYAVIKGWGLAKETTDANLIKQIEATWTDNDLGITQWNHPAYFRCYWETSRSEMSQGKSYNAYTSHIGDFYYTNPNTSDNNKPQYVATVELQYEDGTKAEICKYKGVEYLSEDAVKKAILAENKDYKKRTTTTAGTETTGLTVNDIHFVVTGYQVKAQLNEGVTVYKGEEEATNECNTNMGKSLAEIRKEGRAYYYTDVAHLGTAKGIVRNHFYQIDVKTITGFGTPVYDPDSEFVPVVPEDTQTYLAARINVLSWRIVKQTVDLGK
ncbi:Mfa1 family fimbria major subunit [uncultured Prevotella sp.]|uniref:Mfa1 family fimbria major subunit n=1 Tax=uncultured Prevotella sp. TaxID=159272 RepID=UPI002665642D|nr:Mfa1 family fimbria major subunit [uncultured Prevotella sp.]